MGMLLIAASTYPSFGKQLTNTFSPVTVLFVSEILGGIFVSIYFGLIPLIKEFRSLKKRNRMLLLANGALSGVLAPYFWFKGLHTTSAVNAELFSRSEMLFLILLSAILLKEKFTKFHAFGLATILIGVMYVGLEGFS
ncbi:MAG: DMT family transporter, partial [Candidatus Peribacteraceae bacterium]|nr:DMT family transporter [Candidatus Peribacteraceae bacterium]